MKSASGTTRSRIAASGALENARSVPGRTFVPNTRPRATSGRRDSLIDVIVSGIKNMPGCLGYIVAKDVPNPDALWITEVWDSEASHKASLSLPAVRAAISKGQPWVAGMGEPIIATSVGGHGLPG